MVNTRKRYFPARTLLQLLHALRSCLSPLLISPAVRLEACAYRVSSLGCANTCVGLLACRLLPPSIPTKTTDDSLSSSPASPRPHDNQPHHSHSFPQLAAPHSFNNQPSITPRAPAVAPSLPPPTKTSLTPSWYVHAPYFLPSIQTPEPSHTSLPFVCIHNPHLTPVCPSLSVAQPQLSTVTYKGRRQQSPFTCTLLFPTIKLGSAGQHRAP